MKVSFGKISTKGVFKAEWPYGTDLYGRLLYLEQNGTQVLICAFDFNGSFPEDTKKLREVVSQRTGIPANHIWYHELQIHASPNDSMVHDGIDILISRVADETVKMIASATECDLFVTEADFGTECTFNREQYVEGLGGVTVWSGMSFDENGKPYTQNPDIMLLRGYRPDLPVYQKPIYFDNPNDPKAYLFVFKDKEGKILGTVSRFAAHPDVAVLFELRPTLTHEQKLAQYRYDYDWPGYLSDGFEEFFHAPSMYVNGPCADLSTKKRWDGMDSYEKSAAECKRLAAWFQEKFLDAYRKDSHPVNLQIPLKAETFTVELPMKEDFPYSHEEAKEKWNEGERLKEEIARKVQEGANPAEIKHLIDDEWRNYHFLHMVDSTNLYTDEDLKRHTVFVDVTAMQLGEYLFVGVPGESLVDMTLWLRSEFTGVKTIPIDQVNGYRNYMATPRSMTLGGYTYWSSWVRRDAIPMLKEAIYPLLKEFTKS